MSIIEDVLYFLRRKFRSLLFFSIIIAIAIGGVMFMSPSISGTAQTRVTELVRFHKNAKVKSQENVTEYIDYANLFNRDPFILSLVEKFSNSYQMNLIDGDWYKKSDIDKIKWIKDNLKTAQVDKTNVYQIGLTLKINAKNAEYINQNSKNILADYREQFLKVIDQNYPDSQPQVKDASFVTARSVNNTVVSIVTYSTIGFFASFFILAVLVFMLSPKVQSLFLVKDFYEDTLKLDSIRARKNIISIYNYAIAAMALVDKRIITISADDYADAYDITNNFTTGINSIGVRVKVLNLFTKTIVSSGRENNLTEEYKIDSPIEIFTKDKLTKLIDKSINWQDTVLVVVGDLPTAQPKIAEFMRESACVLMLVKCSKTKKDRLNASLDVMGKFLNNGNDRQSRQICLIDTAGIKH